MSSEREPIISIRNADISGGPQTVIGNLNMEVFPSETVYIIGKVGTGKTSIIRTLIGEQVPEKGSCEVCGMRIERLRTSQIPKLRQNLGVVFQDFQLLYDRSVHDNLDFVLRATGWKKPRERQRRIEEVLDAVGMKTKEHRMPHQLSGGEQQRVAIARAVLNNPKIIIADEPTGNLDRETANEIMSLLRSISETTACALVMVTHDKEIFERFPGRAFICENGECKEIRQGEPIDLFSL